LLDLYEYPGDDTPVIIGSALKAVEGDDSDIGSESINKLVAAMDDFIPIPERPVDQPFLLPIEDVFSISGRGTVVTGRVERGKVIVGEEIVSYDASKSGIQANLSGGSTLESNLLVIAEGRNSTFAKSIGAETFKKDYQQIAQTFLVEIPECKNEEAIQVFYEKEIFALMPYKSDSSAGQFSVVWSMPKDFAKEITANNISTHLQKFEKK